MTGNVLCNLEFLYNDGCNLAFCALLYFYTHDDQLPAIDILSRFVRFALDARMAKAALQQQGLGDAVVCKHDVSNSLTHLY